MSDNDERRSKLTYIGAKKIRQREEKDFENLTKIESEKEYQRQNKKAEAKKQIHKKKDERTKLKPFLECKNR